MRTDALNKDTSRINNTHLRRIWFWMSLPLLITIALWIRIIHIDTMSVWVDEGFTWGYAHFPLGEMLGLLRVDVHPPLYFIFCHYFLTLFPVLEGLRWLSVLFSVLTLLMLMYSMFKFFSPTEAVAIALLFTLSPMQVHYSQEMRMYTLFGLVAFGALHCAMLYAKSFSRLALAGCILFSALMIYTHYYGFVFLIGLFIYIFWARCEHYPHCLLRNIVIVLSAGFVVFLLYLPWFHTFLYHLNVTSFGGYYARATGKITFALFMEMVYQPLLGMVPWLPFPGEGILSILRLSFFPVIFFALVILGVVTSWRDRFLKKVFVCGFLIPILLTLLHIMMSGRFFSRCLIIYLPLLCIFVVRGIKVIKKPWLAGIVLLIICVFFIKSSLLYLNRDIRDVTRESYEYLQEQKKSGRDLVLHVNQTSFMPFWAYGTQGKKRMSNTIQKMILSSETGIMDRIINDGANIISIRKEDVSRYSVIWMICSSWGKDAAAVSIEYQKRIFSSGWKKESERVFGRGIKRCSVAQFIRSSGKE